MMASKKTTLGTRIELAWKDILNQFERGIVRSGKTLAKQSQIKFLSISNGKICAQVNSKGFDGGVYSVELPSVDNWEKHTENLATWFAHHLNWLSACLAGEWCNEFILYIEQSGMFLFPNQSFVKRLQSESDCSCRSLEPVCKHVIGVIQKVIWDMEENPFRAIELVCVNRNLLMSRIHEISSGRVKMSRKLHLALKNETEDFYIKPWMCEKAVFCSTNELSENDSNQQITPELDKKKLKEFEELYMA